MKNYRLAIALLALLTIASFAFPTTGNSGTQNNFIGKSTQKKTDTNLEKQATFSNTLPLRRTIEVDSVQELMWTVETCRDGNVTILIADGTYIIPNGLWITGDNITYKSKSGNRDGVILKGDFKTSHIFWITSDHVTIQDISIGEVNDHGIQILSEKDADYSLVKNVRFFDIKEQMLKGSGNKSKIYSDYTRIEDCLFEFTKDIAYQSYTGGIDVQMGKDWVVKGNTFKNIQYPKGDLTEGAIRFWDGSIGTYISKNTIENCDKGIVLGLENSLHSWGTILDNRITTTRDLGIYLCNAINTTVKNNQVTVPDHYPNAIEYRFKTDGSLIENNIVNRNITSKSGGKARVVNNTFSNY